MYMFMFIFMFKSDLPNHRVMFMSDLTSAWAIFGKRRSDDHAVPAGCLHTLPNDTILSLYGR